ncbi:BlaI/MecI/CopY family transcriptional regulator [Lacipirellula sp.]|uniref:BlaI/MecI/CopY family transcriptional regulator n=1 Tax=Lacipirellula sp. TaxID=2691419 RepID=UPI003D0E997C
MPKKEMPSLGELEARVLQLIWDRQPCTERQVWELIQQERPAARTTVLKTIQRLEAKGLLARQENSAPILWRAAVEQRRALPELVQRFVDGVLGGSAEPLVAYLAGQKKLSDRDVAALQKIAEKLAEQ